MLVRAGIDEKVKEEKKKSVHISRVIGVFEKSQFCFAHNSVTNHWNLMNEMSLDAK